MKKVYIETYGCQMNVNDTEVIFSILADAGYARTEVMEEADLVMANTCSIRDNAEQRIWGRIEVFHQLRKARPDVLVGIVGCMAERLKDKLLDTHKVDLVVGPDAYRSLPRLLEAVHPGSPQIDVLLSRSETYADITPVRTDRNGISAFISIMRGCNNVCSYCVVPYTRGAERSRDASTIVREACDVYARGYKEVTLLGQNVDSYLWKSATETVNFAGLLSRVAAIAPDLRVRFATSHPKDISDEVIAVMASTHNICKHIHLPVQSGSSRMLALMRRKYDREWYLERVSAIRRAMPDCGITTDVIAGFCSETLEDHAATLSLMEEVGFDWAFMFAYSDRPGTLANRTMQDDVPAEEKNRRLNEIIALQNRKSLERYRAQIGRTLEVLVEGPSKRDPAMLCGRASNNMMCVFPALLPEGASSVMPDPDRASRRPGTYTMVRVLDCTSATLICE
ncbi:MAG: tRNA (N6-isopentenyl adenosine(37)-C2)-methylthiotransferase MiaB [Bacteroidales bacterium]|nr:tRNA (N6-isopentenyl adenosine(37)-C2)-methylthiotransferase MiaB [Bacteroidales bacterium]